jgi:hypothetical protein
MDNVSAENAIHSLIIANINGYTADNSKAGEEDAAFRFANLNNKNVCLSDYAGGHEDRQPSSLGKQELWVHEYVFTFFIAFNATTIESQIRSTVQNFIDLRRDNKALQPDTTWRITQARPFSVVKRNDRTWVPVSFSVAVKTPA